MTNELLTEKYKDELVGVLNCYDRIVITGNVQSLCYAQGMTNYLYAHGIRIFDYAQFAKPLRDTLRAHTERLAQENGVPIEFIARSKAFRKEDRVQALLRERGDAPGLICIFSAMEACLTYKPWHDKATGRNYVKPVTGKCLHYYFYGLDADLGEYYVRVPTWAPFRLQIYFNGHNALAQQLKARGIAFEQCDNAFRAIADLTTANQLAATLDLDHLQAKLDQLAAQFCPVVPGLGLTYQWSIMQAEYATDLIFKDAASLQAFYPLLLEALIQAVKPADIAVFLGRKLHGHYQGELDTRFNHRWLGRRLKHHMGPVSIKLYDKFEFILRIETTVNDVKFFKQYRQVHHRDGSSTTQWAPMKKTIHSLPALQEVLLAANQRYLAFISSVDTPAVGVAQLHGLAETTVVNDRRYKGFNLFAEEDATLFRALLHGEFCISGFTNKALRAILPDKTAGQITRILARLHTHGLIKKVSHCYKYYLTVLGRQVAALALELREMVVIPTLAQPVESAA